MYLINVTDKDITLHAGGVPSTFPGNMKDATTDKVVEVGNVGTANFFQKLTYVPPKNMGTGEQAVYGLKEYKPKKGREYVVMDSIYPAHPITPPPVDARINYITKKGEEKPATPPPERLERSRAEMLASTPHDILFKEALNRKLAKVKTCPSVQKLVDLLMPTDYQPPSLHVSRDNPLTDAVAKEKGLRLPSAEEFEAIVNEKDE